MGVWSLTPPLSARVVSGPQASRPGSGAGPASARPNRARSAQIGRQRGLATSFRQQHNQRGLPHRSCSGQGPLHYRCLPRLPFRAVMKNTSRAPGPPPRTLPYITAGAREGPSPPITERPLQLFHHVPASAQPLPTINRDAPKRLSNAPSAPPSGHTETAHHPTTSPTKKVASTTLFPLKPPPQPPSSFLPISRHSCEGRNPEGRGKGGTLTTEHPDLTSQSFAIPAPPFAIPAPPFVIPAPPFVIPAEAGIQRGGAKGNPHNGTP